MTYKAIRRFLQRHRLREVRIVTSAQKGTGLPEVLMQILEGKLAGLYRLAITELSYSQQVLETARRETIDVFIPVLNNMRITDSPPYQADPEAASRCDPEAALLVAWHLRQTYGIPFIAMAGWWPDNWDVTQKTREAGANAFFYVPAESQQLTDAVLDCLDGKATWRTNLPKVHKVSLG